MAAQARPVSLDLKVRLVQLVSLGPRDLRVSQAQPDLRALLGRLGLQGPMGAREELVLLAPRVQLVRQARQETMVGQEALEPLDNKVLILPSIL